MWICVTVNAPAQKSPRHLRKWIWRGPQEAVCSRIYYLPFASSWHQSPSSPLNFPICLRVLLTMPAAACDWPTKLFIKQLSKPFCFSTAYVSQDFFFIFAALLWILSSARWSPPLLKHDAQSWVQSCDFTSAAWIESMNSGMSHYNTFPFVLWIQCHPCLTSCVSKTGPWCCIQASQDSRRGF